jgi:hypothetical protein
VQASWDFAINKIKPLVIGADAHMPNQAFADFLGNFIIVDFSLIP